jgi:oligopeptide transport system ATP-binding protein
MTAILEVENLTKVFGRPGAGVPSAVENVSFELVEGGSLAIVGESGSGKTTVARIVARLESATSGRVMIDGQPMSSRMARGPAARVVQMVFQDPFGSLDPRQRVGDGIAELLRLHGLVPARAARGRVEELLDAVGLDPAHGRRLPRHLSGGQRQRVAIARALALDPRLLILDEAVSALDVSVQAQILNLLIDIRAATGISYLFISHDLAVVRQITDTCLVLHAGRLVESGATARVLDAPSAPYTRDLLAAVPRPGWTPSRRRSPDSTPSPPEGTPHGP